jgi:O-antigen/teichoic acid export membrane protein
MGAGTWGAILGAVAAVAAVVAQWWWSGRKRRQEKQRTQENEEISRRAGAGDAGWFNDRLDQWMRQGDD